MKKFKIHLYSALACFALCMSMSSVADAATLKVNPSTGVYTVGSPFTVSVLLNTDGAAVNAADGQLSFNPRELQVVNVTRSSSIFNLWTEEPTFSNSAGTISFGGGSPTGYKGSSGNIISVVFKALGAGTPKVSFKGGSVLAADGLGTNVLTGMSSASFTIAAASESPAPEYIPPPNTPKVPVITSATHPNSDSWYTKTTAELAWNLPSDVIAIRTLLDSNPGSVPSVVYDSRISNKTIDDLEEGVTYFHLQFKNNEGWGKIAHYRLGVDTIAPLGFGIVEDPASQEGKRTLQFNFEDVSPVYEYKIQIDGKEPLIFKDEKLTKRYTLDVLPPGHHTVIVEAVDSAGNSSGATYSFDEVAFEKPIFIDFPTRINTEVIPAIKGKTKPNAKIAIEVRNAEQNSIIETVHGDDSSDPYTIQGDADGNFTYIPDSKFVEGVYVITAIAKDSSGRLSEKSDEIKIIVEVPGYVAAGTTIINALSIVIPLISLTLVLIFGTWFLWHKLRVWKRKIEKETIEAEESLKLEFNTIIGNLHEKISVLKESRKGKLTLAESGLIDQIESDIAHARTRITKEIEDIEDIVS